MNQSKKKKVYPSLTEHHGLPVEIFTGVQVIGSLAQCNEQPQQIITENNTETVNGDGSRIKARKRDRPVKARLPPL